MSEIATVHDVLSDPDRLRDVVEANAAAAESLSTESLPSQLAGMIGRVTALSLGSCSRRCTIWRSYTTFIRTVD